MVAAAMAPEDFSICDIQGVRKDPKETQRGGKEASSRGKIQNSPPNTQKRFKIQPATLRQI
jgi:hypothetical protein